MIENKDLDLSWVNSIKGLSIIGVFIVHTYSKLPIIMNFSPLLAVANQGRLGALVFYMISGFLLCVSYDKCKHKTKREFFFRKVIRLMPLAWFVSVLRYVMIGGYTDKVAIVASLFFVDVFNPEWWGYIHNGWISILVLMYLLFVIFKDRINTIQKAFGMSIMVWYGSIIGQRLIRMAQNDTITAWGGYILLGLPCFALGILLYYILINYQEILKKQTKTIADTLLAISVFYILCHVIFDGGTYFEKIYTEFVIAIVLMILSLVIRKNVLFVNPLFDFLGKYSYGIFLTHLTIPGCFPQLELANPYLNTLVLFLMSVIFAYLFETYVEKPLLQFLDRMFFTKK